MQQLKNDTISESGVHGDLSVKPKEKKMRAMHVLDLIQLDFCDDVGNSMSKHYVSHPYQPLPHYNANALMYTVQSIP